MKSLKNAFTIFCLVSTSVVTIATSKSQPRQQPPTGTVQTQELATSVYLVASNCPNGVVQDRLVLIDGRINEPRDVRFSDFGLPIDRLDFSQKLVSGSIDGISRSCQYSTQNVEGIFLQIYTCYENNRPICQISFESDK